MRLIFENFLTVCWVEPRISPNFKLSEPCVCPPNFSNLKIRTPNIVHTYEPLCAFMKRVRANVSRPPRPDKCKLMPKIWTRRRRYMHIKISKPPFIFLKIQKMHPILRNFMNFKDIVGILDQSLLNQTHQ